MKFLLKGQKRVSRICERIEGFLQGLKPKACDGLYAGAESPGLLKSRSI